MIDIGSAFSGTWAIFRRELGAYFSQTLAYVFLVVFLLSIGLFTWYGAGFFQTGRADLAPFFVWHPWLYVVFMPALAMRLWAEEVTTHTNELLLSLPIGTPGIVLGKFMAGWCVAGLGLILTFPIWISVNYLGPADNSAIALAYGVSFLMAGAYLAVAMAVSVFASSQVTAFVLAVVAVFLFTAAGWPLVLAGVGDVFGAPLAEQVAAFSFLTYFEVAQRGVLELGAVVFYISIILLGGFLSGLWVTKSRGS